MRKVQMFVDYWNFQLRWNERAGEGRCNWAQLPAVLLDRLKLLRLSGELDYQGMRVYASCDPDDENLRRWLENFLERQPGTSVVLLERRRRFDHIRCRACGYETNTCPSCGQALVWSAEKGVESALITDLFELSWADAMDIAVVVSSDSDFVFPVVALQGRGVKVINAAWRGAGQELARAYWATIDLDELIPSLVREASGERRPTAAHEP
ncbi:MAG: NYN domain-containing protein, partial [Acidobacteriota bacterium]